MQRRPGARGAVDYAGQPLRNSEPLLQGIDLIREHVALAHVTSLQSLDGISKKPVSISLGTGPVDGWQGLNPTGTRQALEFTIKLIEDEQRPSLQPAESTWM